MSDIIVIADLQVVKGCKIDHIHALSRYIWKHKPAHIVNIGDTFDFESLSHFASPMDKEGRRLKDDLEAGYTAMKAIMAAVDKGNKRSHKSNKEQYSPSLDFTMGNHEFRLDRFIENTPVLSGMIDLTKDIENMGWNVHKFLHPFWLYDICFNHFMPNPESGRPVGGGVENKMNKFPHSFVHGHQQKFQFARRQNLQGKPHFGVCAGSFYLHDEDYRGANNTEIRGFTHLRAFKNRYGYLDHDVEFVSLERLLQNW